MSRFPHEADDLARAIDTAGCAILPIPAGVGQAARACLLDAVTDHVTALRREGRDVHARSVSGIRLGLPAIDLALVVWEGDDAPEIAGADA